MQQDQVAPTVAIPPQAVVLPRRPARWENIVKFVRKKPLGAAGFLLVGFMLVMTLGTPKLEVGVPQLPNRPLGIELGKPWISRYHAEDLFFTEDNRLAVLQGPSAAHWLGTDRNGRDIWARLVFGARRSLFVGLWALGLATAAGTAIGVVSGYFRGWVDTSTQRVMDALQSFPPLIALILIITINPFTSQPNLTVAAFALGLVGIPQVQRVVRGVVMATREQQYVEAARVIGASDMRTMVYYILPNIMASIIVVFSTGLGVVILAEAALSFIVPQNVPQGPSWGLMLSEGQATIIDSPGPALWSSTFIALAVLGFNLAGDALRDVLDPRLRVG